MGRSCSSSAQWRKTMFSLYCLSSPPSPYFYLTPLLFLYDSFYIFFISFKPSFSVSGYLPFLPPPLLPSFSHSLFSSSCSSSAADCCPSYLCSRLGMFFLLMTSILSLPFTSLPVFCLGCAPARCFLSVSPPTHLGLNCRCFIGLGWRRGWRQGHD